MCSRTSGITDVALPFHFVELSQIIEFNKKKSSMYECHQSKSSEPMLASSIPFFSVYCLKQNKTNETKQNRGQQK